MAWSISCVGARKLVTSQNVADGIDSEITPALLVELDASKFVADTFRLGESLSPLQIEQLNNWQVLQSMPGREAHSVLSKVRDTSQPSFFVINDIDSAGKTSTRVFPVMKPAQDIRMIFDPQFSPDGRYILFKFGATWAPGTYQLYVFDTNTEKTQLVCLYDLEYYAVSWSPDSQYIAFAKGKEDPRIYDNGRTYTGELELCICEWRTGQAQTVATSRTMRGPWNWKAPHTLLYSRLASGDESIITDPGRQEGIDFVNGIPIGWERVNGSPKRKPVTPSIYEYSPEKRVSELLVHDAYLPVASADGKRLAFFGSSDVQHPFALSEDWPSQLSSSFIVVTDAKGNHLLSNTTEAPKRDVLSQHSGRYPELIWLPDGQHLLVMEHTSMSPNAKIEIKEWNVDTKKSRLVTTLQVDEIERRSPNSPNFQALAIDTSGKHLMMSVEEYYSVGKNKGVLNQGSLKDIELVTGKTTTVENVRPSFGVGWYYLTRPKEVN